MDGEFAVATDNKGVVDALGLQPGEEEVSEPGSDASLSYCGTTRLRAVTAVRFLHTSDWQLGMKRVFLEGDAQTLFSEARLDAVRRIGALTRDQDCAFAVVCGDVFESNRLIWKSLSSGARAGSAAEVRKQRRSSP
jgi:hypothetical protein